MYFLNQKHKKRKLRLDFKCNQMLWNKSLHMFLPKCFLFCKFPLFLFSFWSVELPQRPQQFDMSALWCSAPESLFVIFSLAWQTRRHRGDSDWPLVLLSSVGLCSFSHAEETQLLLKQVSLTTTGQSRSSWRLTFVQSCASCCLEQRFPNYAMSRTPTEH